MKTPRIMLLAVVLCLSVPGSAQKSDQTPQFRSETNLVLVPVQVRSKGQHVSGLKQDAFTLLQDGKEQKISTFEEVRTTTERLKRRPVDPNGFTNELVGSPETARYTVIAIDRINTKTFDMIRLRDGLLKFLSQAADTGEPIRLVSIEPNGIRTIQDFTTDPKTIALALQRTATPAGQVGQSSAPLNNALQEFEIGKSLEVAGGDGNPEELATFLKQLDSSKAAEQQMIAFQQRTSRISSLEALQQLAVSLAGLPGRKSLVWASSGYPFTSLAREGRASVSYDFSQVTEASTLDEYTTHLISAANIALYPVDARGTVNTAFDVMDPSHKYSPSYAEKQAAQAGNQDVISTFEHLAASTGGKPCFERADLSGCFKDAMEDSHEYYMLGFYINSKDTKDGWHKLQVKVVEKGVSVRSRNGYLYPILDPIKTRDRDMGTAINSLLLDAGLPFRGQWMGVEPKGDKKSAKFEIRIDPAANVIDSDLNKINIEFAGTARAKDGTVAARFAQKIERSLPPEAVASIKVGGINYKNSFDLPPGDYLVRFIVRDNLSGRIGGVSTMLKVQ